MNTDMDFYGNADKSGISASDTRRTSPTPQLEDARAPRLGGGELDPGLFMGLRNVDIVRAIFRTTYPNASEGGVSAKRIVPKMKSPRELKKLQPFLPLVIDGGGLEEI